MGDFSARGKAVDVTVAGAVEGEVAQKAAQVGVVRPVGAFGEEGLSCLSEELSAGEIVHPSSLRVQRVVGEGLVVEKQVRAV